MNACVYVYTEYGNSGIALANIDVGNYRYGIHVVDNRMVILCVYSVSIHERPRETLASRTSRVVGFNETR